MSESPADIQHATLDWDAEGQPLSRSFGDVYFSRANGLEETRHVFLHHNQLRERFTQLAENAVFTLGETGFGSGLNFLACWQLWRDCAPTSARMHFITTEKYPLTKSDLIRALALWPELTELTQALTNNYPSFTNKGFHRLTFEQGRVALTLIIDDAAAGLAQLVQSTDPQFADHPNTVRVNAWFLDGFAPAKNPQMWSPELFANIRLLSGAGTTAATFSAAGSVKQGLRSAGFTVQKVPGYGRKREMVRAVFDVSPSPDETKISHSRYYTHETPWPLTANPQTPLERTAIIIGAGLAGCQSARALAERGWQVTIIERHAAVAQGASGNPQGVLYAKLSPKQEALGSFNLASLQFALRYYAPFWQTHANLGQACGVLQLAHNTTEQILQQDLQSLYENCAQDLVRFVDKTEASTVAGIPLSHGGLYFPTAGWINPQKLCEVMVTHPNIRIELQSEALSLNHCAGRWQVSGSSPSTDSPAPIAQAAVLVIANAADALSFAQTRHLPLKNIRGQVSYVPASTTSRKLKTVICSDGYLAPSHTPSDDPSNKPNSDIDSTAKQPEHCLGATFNLKVTDSALSVADHHTNMVKICAQVPALADDWHGLAIHSLAGRVAFRCATTDYLPVVGPAPIYEDFLSTYAPLRKNARARIAAAGSYWPHLYLNLGLGSRGLAYAPLCAELLAAQITGEVPPLARDLAQALHPARFIIRNLQRNRC